MKLSGPVLRQRDGVTCGPTVAVVAGLLLDPHARTHLDDRDGGLAWCAAEQARVHADINRVWPRRLGTTPRGLVRAFDAHSRRLGVRYRWRFFRGRRDRLADVRSAVADGWPVAMLVGRVIPRHWVLIVAVDGPRLDCFEPTSGQVRTVDIDSIRRARLTGVGFARPFAFVLPRR
ncbi:hypothetical protein [Mycolicibacterium rutilum]|nr:hypothetical protein [Mycolicibacterium rutilum]